MSHNVVQKLDDPDSTEILDLAENPGTSQIPATSETPVSSVIDRDKAVALFPIPLAWNLLLGLLCCVAVLRLAPQWMAWTFGTSTRSLNQVPVFVVDVNRASVEELQALPEVGIVLAQRMVDYRLTHGNFRSIDELQNVHGFGPKRLENLRDLLTVQGDMVSASNPIKILTPIDGKLNAN